MVEVFRFETSPVPGFPRHVSRDCEMHGRTSDNGGLPIASCCCRLPRHAPHVAASDASARSTVLDCPRHKWLLSASAFSLRYSSSFDLHFAQRWFFFNDNNFLCVVVGQNQSPTATSGFLGGFGSAHSRVTGRIPLPPGWHFVGTHPLPSGCPNCAKSVSKRRHFFIFFLPRFDLLPSRLQQAAV